MTRSIHRSATVEQRIIAEEAEDTGERRGILRGIEMCIALHEAEGDTIAAQRLRAAQIVSKGNLA